MVLSTSNEFFIAITTEALSAAIGISGHRTSSHPQGQLAMKGQRLKISIIDLADATPMIVERIRIVSRVELGDVIRDAAHVARRHPDKEVPIGNHILEWQPAV